MIRGIPRDYTDDHHPQIHGIHGIPKGKYIPAESVLKTFSPGREVVGAAEARVWPIKVIP
jgi:hypothetical protein